MRWTRSLVTFWTAVGVGSTVRGSCEKPTLREPSRTPHCAPGAKDHVWRAGLDVVTAWVVAGVGHDRGGAAVEGEQRVRGGDVAEVGEEIFTVGAAGGVDLDDLPAGDPPHDVEVVDRAVAEDPA